DREIHKEAIRFAYIRLRKTLFDLLAVLYRKPQTVRWVADYCIVGVLDQCIGQKSTRYEMINEVSMDRSYERRKRSKETDVPFVDIDGVQPQWNATKPMNECALPCAGF